MRKWQRMSPEGKPQEVLLLLLTSTWNLEIIIVNKYKLGCWMTMTDIGPSSLCPQPTLSEAEPPSLSAIDPTHETASKVNTQLSPAQTANPLNCDRNKRELFEGTKLGMEVFPNKRLNNTVVCDFVHSIYYQSNNKSVSSSLDVYALSPLSLLICMEPNLTWPSSSAPHFV